MRRPALWVTAIVLSCGPVSAQTPPVSPGPGPSEKRPPFYVPLIPPKMIDPTNSTSPPAGRVGTAPAPSGLDALQMPVVPRPEDTVWGNPQAENLVSFDNRLAEVAWSDNNWRITAGGVTLKEFGRRE